MSEQIEEEIGLRINKIESHDLDEKSNESSVRNIAKKHNKLSKVSSNNE